jgi:hypothetical protein
MSDRWRVGRKVGRTIYRQLGPEPSDDDELIGMMDTVELAQEAATAHNLLGALARIKVIAHPFLEHE